MRDKFDEQLHQLNNQLILMGATCEYAISLAIAAIFESGDRHVEEVNAAEEKIDRQEKEIETLCLRLLLQQQPVAKDLRVISSALKMITDLERIGDQAADIAELASYVALGEGESPHLRTMASAAVGMVTDAIDAFVRQDLALAQAVIGRDDEVDAAFCTVKRELIAEISDDPSRGEQAIDLLMIAKYLERIADHATNLAEWVVFSISGSRPL